MRVRLLTNNMLNGYSLKMCQDYWQPFNYPNQHPFSLEWHIKHICHHYDVTSEELITRLSMVKAYDSYIRCDTCGKMYELNNPCKLPNPDDFISWQFEDCKIFMQRGVINLHSFLVNIEDDDCPF